MGKTYDCLIFSPQASKMTSNIVLPLSLLAHSILVVLCNLEAALEAASFPLLFPIKALKTPHTPKIEKNSFLTDLGVRTVKLIFQNACF